MQLFKVHWQRYVPRMIKTRRARMRRQSIGKSIALTDRDIEIFRALFRYRYLRSTYLHAFAGGESEKRFKERLGDLFHEGFIDRPHQQWQFANCRHRPAVYELGKGAERALQESAAHAEPVTFLSTRAHRQFQHSLLICEILASLELAAKQCGGVRFVSWPQILRRAPLETQACDRPFEFSFSRRADMSEPDRGNGMGVTPDAFFGLEYRQHGKPLYRFCALEADRGTMPLVRVQSAQSSYMQKLRVYREVIDRQLPMLQLGVPNVLVLTVTASQRHRENMISALQNGGGSDARFLFQAIDASAGEETRPVLRLLTDTWRRAGFAPVCLAEGS